MKWINLIVLLFFLPVLQAQDTLFLINGEKIACEVGIYDEFSVDYTPWKKSQPVYTVQTSLLDSMRFNTGQLTNFAMARSEKTVSKETTTFDTSIGGEVLDVQSYEKGYIDGYNNSLNKTIGPLSCASGFCCAGSGLSIGVPFYYSIKHSDFVPLKNKVGNSSYDKGVRDGIKKKVIRKTWGNFAGGVIAFGALYAGFVFAFIGL